MLEYKQSVQAFVPVRLLDSTGAPVTGKAHTDVSVAIMKSDGTESSLSLSAPDWVELSTGAWSGNGAYRLRLSTSNLDTTGMLMYTVRCAGATDYDGIVKVVANEEADTYARIGAPVGASISADVATRAPAATALSTADWTVARAGYLDLLNTNLDVVVSTLATASALTALSTKIGTPADTDVSTDIANMMSKVTRNQLFREGRLKIHTTGPDANRQVQYASDGTTVLQKWDLKDSSGSATTSSIFERVPVDPIP